VRNVTHLLSVVRRLRLLFLQLYKSVDASVRPDEELAYLAITRPEVDRIVEPEVTVIPPLNSIPTMPSPSSTLVNTPDLSPEAHEISSPISDSQDGERSRSVLGKRASQDRENSSGSSGDVTRHKGDTALDPAGIDVSMEIDRASDDYEMVAKPDRKSAHSPSNMTDIAGLDLKSPTEEKELDWTTSVGSVQEPTPSHTPPLGPLIVQSGPPPLPPRPPLPARQDTLASGLRFGETILAARRRS